MRQFHEFAMAWGWTSLFILPMVSSACQQADFQCAHLRYNELCVFNLKTEAVMGVRICNAGLLAWCHVHTS